MTRSLLLLALLVTALAGCGGGSEAGGGGPAALVPRDAGLYVEATVRPEGRMREDALAAAGKVFDTTDPAARISELLEQAQASGGEPKLDYARDVEPWLGDRIALWLASGGVVGEFRGVALAATTDPEGARESIRAAMRRHDVSLRARSHQGVDYEVGEDGESFAVVEGFLALGTEAELKRTIDAADGESLADDERYAKIVGELPEGRIAHFFARTELFTKAAMGGGEPGASEQYEQLRRIFPFDEIGPYAGSLSIDGERIALDTITTARSGEAFRQLGLFGGAASTPLLGELPGDAWGAFGTPKLGETLKLLVGRFAGAFGGAALSQQLRQETGLDLEQDILSWIGDAAFFVRGSTPDTVDGGAVIAVTDEERAATAFGKIVGALSSRGGLEAKPVRIEGAESAFALSESGQPKPVVLARSRQRVVVAYGEAAAAAALSPAEKLADSDAYGEARALLGDELDPGLLLSIPALLSLVEASGEADAEFAKVKAYLDALTVLSLGGETSDDRSRSRVAVGLR